jgi:hypothetical protein
MEWVVGERLRSASPSSLDSDGAAAGPPPPPLPPGEGLRLVEVGVRCSLEQMLEQGFYHGKGGGGALVCLLSARG